MKDLQFVTPDLWGMMQDENHKQVEKFGIQDRSPFEWMAYITEEVGELAQAISEFEYRNGTPGAVIKEAIQAATLCLKVAEMFKYISYQQATRGTMPKKVTAIEVRIEQDALEGWGHEAVDHVKYLEHMLSQSIPHYHPEVRFISERIK